jgi:hypothetical protein
MRLIIHDLPPDDAAPSFPPDETSLVIPAVGPKAPCLGCFGCWLKTPGKCVLKDRIKDMGKYLSSCNELIVITKCIYGGFSPDVKNVIDRSISYILPFFRNVEHMQHHVPRYQQRFRMRVFAYNTPQLTDDERAIFGSYVKGVSINLNSADYSVVFLSNPGEVSI